MTEPAGTTYTKRLGMRVPGMDDELDALRPNWDRLDNTMAGAIWVADGVTPENNLLFEGALIAEIDSGKVWRAARNISGVYEKKYIKYPWCITAYTATAQDFGANNVADHLWGFDTIDFNYSVNANVGSLVNSNIVVPVTGIYVGCLIARWSNLPIDGLRSLKIAYNGVPDTLNSEVIKQAVNNAGNGVICSSKFEATLNAGDTISASLWQNSSQVTAKVQTIGTVGLVRVT